MKEIKKIVITGGPCAGKTSILDAVKERYSQLDYTVFVVNEVATDLINSGITPELFGKKDFQHAVFVMQVNREKFYTKIAQKLNKEKILIVYDRGLLDGSAYLNEKEFMQIAYDENIKTEDIVNRYDAVFCLNTAAKENSEFYTKENNIARSEEIDEAIKLDDCIINVWKNHTCFKIIENFDDFEKKIDSTISAIDSYLL